MASFVKIMKRATAVSSLPDDIIIVILSMLPVKSIIRFRCVSKLWLERFKNPNFIKMHLTNYSVEKNNYSIFIGGIGGIGKKPSYYRVDFDAASASYLSNNKAVRIDFPSALHRKLHNSRTWVGSCNGIICFSRLNMPDFTVTFFLWNPYSQEYKEIQEYRKMVTQSYDKYIWGYWFCYDCKIDDYKLIMIYDDNHGLSEIQVYTLGSNSWKTVGKSLSVYNGQHFSCVLEGAVHWLARKVIVTENKPTASMVIVSFDIAEETTKEIQLPSSFSELHKNCRYSSNARVGVLGKELYLSDSVSEIFELWVMKDYGVVDSWTKVLRFSQKMKNIRICRTLSYCNKNCEILFSCSLLQDNCKNALVSYDLRSENFTLLEINDMPERFKAESFIGSLVSINPSGRSLKSCSSKKEKRKRTNFITTRSRTQVTKDLGPSNDDLGRGKRTPMPKKKL